MRGINRLSPKIEHALALRKHPRRRTFLSVLCFLLQTHFLPASGIKVRQRKRTGGAKEENDFENPNFCSSRSLRRRLDSSVPSAALRLPSPRPATLLNHHPHELSPVFALRKPWQASSGSRPNRGESGGRRGRPLFWLLLIIIIPS